VIGATADTNVYISALVFAGVPGQFLKEAEAGHFSLAISDAILNEIWGVLRDKFAWSEAAIAETRSLLSGCTTLVQPAQSLDVVPDDPDDNRIIECAVAAGSRFIVTGDEHLLRLGNYENIQILKVTDFLKLMEGLAL
jgi:putative PIN family toxin of toxin-antitoxin system